MSKVTVVGAGNVGATCVNAMAIRETAGEIVLLDIKEGLAEGKVLDMYQTSTLMDFDTNLLGVTNDYAKTAGSDVVVITSGMPRKPGMSREDLIGVNAGIVKDVVTNILKYSPDAILLIVSNPMDTMTTLAQKVSGLPTNRVFGMGGALDSARFRGYLAKALGASANDVDGMVIGGHGDTTMIPLVSKASYKGVPVSEFLDEKTLGEIAAATMVGGAPSPRCSERRHGMLLEQPLPASWKASSTTRRKYSPPAYTSKDSTVRTTSTSALRPSSVATVPRR